MQSPPLDFPGLPPLPEPGPYGLFLWHGCGEEEPGTYIEHGEVLLSDGRVFDCWFKWRSGGPSELIGWTEISHEVGWYGLDEYQEARREVGLC